MNRIFRYFILGAISLSMFSCQVEKPEIIDTTGSTGITSVSAKFNSGALAADPNAVFTTTVTDPANPEIIIQIPAFYPKESDNAIKPEDLRKMRVQAALENGVALKPALGLMDLNQDNHVEATLPSGAVLKYIIKGKIEKLHECILEELTLTDSEGETFGCLIDNDKKTVTAMSVAKQELKDCKAVYRISPHATVSSPDMKTAKTWKSGDKLVVTAHDGETKTEYTFSISVPEKVEYGMRISSGVMKWMKYYNTDFGVTLKKDPITRLAVIGDYLAVSTGSGVFVINRSTGAKVKEISLPAGAVVHSIANDEAGHIIFAANTAHNAVMSVYMIDASALTAATIAPVELFKTNSQANISGCTIGNLRVRGDVTKNAVITAIAGAPAPGWYLAWEIKNGTPTNVVKGIAKGVFGKTAGKNAFWKPQGGCVAPAGNSFADGMFYIGYDGVRNLFFTPTIIKNAPWKQVVVTGNVGNENLNCLATATFNNAKYVAYLMAAHFSYGACPTAKIFDYSNADAIAEAMVFEMKRPEKLGGFKNIGASSDIALYVSPDGYKMNMYWTDGNYDVIGCYEFDCIKK